MKRRSVVALAFVALFALSAQTPTGWVTLFDGKTLNNFNAVGTANWKLADGIVEATSGNGFLVSKELYGNFELKVEFWVDANANSGVYMRCQDSVKLADTTCYEANIFDKRPDQSGRSGAIVHVAKPSSVIDTAGKWNTYEITMSGSRLIVKLNGVQTVDVDDEKFSRGPVALQYAAGTVRFRNVQIRPL